jgi:hypothetical protein
LPILEKHGLSSSLNGESLSFAYTLFLAALAELTFLEVQKKHSFSECFWIIIRKTSLA